MSITEIKQAIKKLSREELARFHEWLEGYYAELGDKQIERDAKSGRLNRFIAETDEENALIEERRNDPERALREYSNEKKK